MRMKCLIIEAVREVEAGALAQATSTEQAPLDYVGADIGNQLTMSDKALIKEALFQTAVEHGSAEAVNEVALALIENFKKLN